MKKTTTKKETKLFLIAVTIKGKADIFIFKTLKNRNLFIQDAKTKYGEFSYATAETTKKELSK